MKKTLLFAAVAAVFTLASCQNDSESEMNPAGAPLVFTATIDDGATRTTVNTDSTSSERGKVTWEETDTITISIGSKSAVYKVQSINKGIATFEKKSGDDLETSGVTYEATYGSAPATTQTYSATAGKLPMSASSTTTSLKFTTTCGLLKLKLTNSEKKISKVIVSGGSPRKSYTLTCDNEDISEGKDFYVALPAGNYNHIVCVNPDGAVCSKVASEAVSIAANQIQPISFSNLTFTSALLPYEFSVSANKQVMFTKGNLYYSTTDSKYHIESAQNVTYATLGQSTYTASHVCHFLWTTTAAASYQSGNSEISTTNDVPFFAESKGGLTVDGQGGLYALSKAEWNHLFNIRTNASSLYKCGVLVTTSAGTVQNCLVIAPDGYSGSIAGSYSETEWATAESAGLVCLPAAAYRTSSTLKTSKLLYGYYWSATPNGTGNASDLYFTSSSVSPAHSDSRGNNGRSVRLVCSVK